MLRILLSMIVSFLISGISRSQNSEIDAYLQTVIQQRNIPGISVCVIENDQIIYKGNFGFANLETESLVKSESVFQLASLTKPFTALAIMKLVSEGKINLENPVTSYIDSLPENYNQIKVKNLLNHTSGLPEQVNLEYNGAAVMDISTSDQLGIITGKPMLFPTGESGSYSDPGYFLLGMIIEKVSGLKYGDYLRENIFIPLGMNNSQIEDRWKIIKNRVQPYRYINNMTINGRRDYQHELPSHYGILSTLDDLSKWSVALRNYKIIDSLSLLQMWSPAKLNNGEEVLIWGNKYGYGWFLGDLRGEKFAEHGGFTGTHYLHFTDKDLSIIILSNLDVMSGSDARSIAKHIAGMVSPDLAKPEKNSQLSVTEDKDITGKILLSLNEISGQSYGEAILPEYISYINKLPSPVKDRFIKNLSSVNSVEFIGMDNLSDKDITRSGDKITAIYHYILNDENSNSVYSFYITGNDKIAWIERWN